jgi:hypothetical protein
MVRRRTRQWLARVGIGAWVFALVVALAGCGTDASDPGGTTQSEAELSWRWRRPAPTPAPTPPPPTDTAPAPAGGPAPSEQLLPRPTGTCPSIVAGDVTFAPAGIAPRKVRIWIGPAAATADGPLVFYWHGTGSSPSEAVTGLSQAVIDEIVSKGGIVAAPYADPAAGTFPWFLTASRTRMDDLLVADEVLACARQGIGVDVRRIHSIGMSAGGLQTTQMSYRRSGYVASVVTYSGGLLSAYGAPARQDPSNHFAALLFDGGPNDVIVINFQQASEAYWSDLVGHDQFAAICNHGRGHIIPTDARGSVRDFFVAHPFGVTSPYAAGLPATFPSYCALSP